MCTKIDKLQPEPQASKRRKLAAKSSGSEIVAQEVSYHYKTDWRNRRYSSTPRSAQSMSQQMQALVLHNTVDIDLLNSIFVCLQQAVRRLSVTHKEVFRGALNTLDALAADRAAFCEKELGMDEAKGKGVLHSMVNGGAAPFELRDRSGVTKLKDLARLLRWLAPSLMPREFDAMVEIKKQKRDGRNRHARLLCTSQLRTTY